MKQIRCLLGILFLAVWIPQVFACVPATSTDIQQRLNRESLEQLVFFASWCGSCRQHLRPEKLDRSLFIAVFDDIESARKGLIAYLGEKALSRCYWDQDGSIAQAYQVKSLPATRPVTKNSAK